MTEEPGESRRLIVNADDFGRSAPINRGIIQAHENGIVTSASLMVRWPAAEDAAAYARRRPGLSVGLHLDLGEMVFRGEEWVQTYEVVDAEDADAVTAEAQGQLERFRELMGRDPSHLDSHQHVHSKTDAARGACAQLATDLGIPLREQDPRVRYCGDFYGQSTEGYPLPEALSPQALISIIESLPPGTTELGCHPGDGSETGDVYDSERRLELRSLCAPAVRRAINQAGIELVSYAAATG